MESIVVACITGVVTLVGVLLSNSKSRAIMEYKIDELSARVEKHNNMIERQQVVERDVAVLKNDVVTLYHKVGD